MTAWRTYARLFTGSERLLVTSLVVSLVQALLLIPIALIIRHVFDSAIPAGGTWPLIGYGAAILGLFLASSALGLWTRYLILRATKRAVARIRDDLLAKVLSLPMSYFDRTALGTTHATIVQDSERLDVMSNALLAQLLPAAVISAALSVALIVLDPVLFAVLVAAMPVLVLLSRKLGRSVRRLTREWQRSFDDFSSGTHLVLRGIATVAARGAEAEEARRTQAQHRELEQAGLAMAWQKSAYTIANGTIAAAAIAIVLVLGGHAVGAGDVTVGDLAAFFAVAVLLRGQLTSILVALPEVVAGYESLARLQAFLDEPATAPYHGRRRIHFRGEVVLDGVSFGYGDNPVLEGIDLRLEAGELVALVGANGAGKSTVARLMLGLYRPEHGRLLADGVPYDELDLNELRRRIGLVPQDPLIFPATIAENVAYGIADPSTSVIRAAAELAGAASFVEALPRGYETFVGDDGVLLSGGQRQQLALARALIAGPSLLVLDEPTTYLDGGAKRHLFETLGQLEGTTILVISHDDAVAGQAERAYELAAGRAVETGGQLA